MAKIRLIVTEKLQLVRKSLIVLLKEHAQMDVVDEAASSKELMDKLKFRLVDIVILDYDRNDLAAMVAIDTIKNRFPEVKLIVSGVSECDTPIADIMAKGANSFVCKTSSPEGLYSVILGVHKSGYYFDDSLSKALLNGVIVKRSRKEVHDIPDFKQRELDVIRAICEGLSYREIADLLNISLSTVDFYRSSIYQKISCHNVAGLMKFAIKNGIVQLN